jgi:hypothetical protein
MNKTGVRYMLYRQRIQGDSLRGLGLIIINNAIIY